MSTVTVHAFVFGHDMKDLTRYADIVIAMIITQQLKCKIVPGLQTGIQERLAIWNARPNMRLKLIPVKLLIKLLKNKIVPVSNNTKQQLKTIK